jgi:signal transduction histidine kinase/CheY-like chemotaxis protein
VEQLDLAMKNCSNYNVEYRFRKKNGQYIFIEDMGLFLAKNSKAYRMLGTMADVSERKISEEKLKFAKEKAEEASRFKSSMLRNINHELRTPMNSILGFSQILVTKSVTTDIKDMSEKILDSGKRLMNTLNSIIDLAELESGDIGVVLNEENLTDIIKILISKFKNQCENKGLYLTTSLDDSIRVLTSSPILIKAIIKIVENAIKFTEKGGLEITSNLELIDKKPYAKIKIADTGIGIDPKYISIIFEPFKQVSEGYGREYEGTGLGLTISKRLLQQIGAEITVESHCDKGSVFSINLPALDANSIQNAGMPAISQKTVFSEKSGPELEAMKKILLVEDNPLNKELTYIFLKDKYKLDSATDGHIALDLASKVTYDAILIDINLKSDMDGMMTATEIKKLPAYANIPIAAITGYISDENKIVFSGSPFNYFLGKPYEQEKLMMLLQKMFNK